MSNALSIFNQLRPVTVGYDNIFDHFEKMFEDDFFKFLVRKLVYFSFLRLIMRDIKLRKS